MGTPFIHRMKVHFGDTDPAGIVYYPRFFHYYHVAFEELFAARAEEDGRNYAHLIQERRVGLPAVRVECDYKHPLRFGDEIDVEISAERIGTKSVTLRYKVRIGDTLCGDGKVTSACVNMDTFKTMPIPDDLRRLFESVQA